MLKRRKLRRRSLRVHLLRLLLHIRSSAGVPRRPAGINL